MPTPLADMQNVICRSLNLVTPPRLAQLLQSVTPHGFNDQACRKSAVYAILDDAARILVIQKPCYNDGYPWAGQIAFPGGRVEEDDRSFLDAALREVFEEVGIDRRQLHTIGSLGRFPTVHNVSIEAFIGFTAEPVTPRPQAGEVERVMWLELADLLETHLANGYTACQVSVKDLLYPALDATIWGATARIIQFLLNMLIANQNQ